MEYVCIKKRETTNDVKKEPSDFQPKTLKQFIHTMILFTNKR